LLPETTMPSTVTAAVSFGAGKPFEFADLQLDDPRPDELLIDVKAVGLCHSDLTAQGMFDRPVVLGHEGAGVVAAVGSAVSGYVVGDHVVLSFNSCGACASCWSGRPARCRNFAAMNYAGGRPDGSPTLSDASGPVAANFFGQSSFSNRTLATARNAVKIPAEVPFEVAAPLGCGVITGAGTVINTLRPGPADSLAVFGVGAVGLSAVLAAASLRVGTVIAVDVVPERLELARRLGATHVIDGSSSDVSAQLREIVPDGAGFAIETSGQPTVVRTAVDALAEGGTCALLGLASFDGELSLSHLTVLSGRTIVGVTEGDSVPHITIPHLLALRSRGLFDLDALVSTYPFADLAHAIEDTKTGRAVKAVLTFGD
jgi:aryl-alcohol dehydrogenase